MGVLSAMLITLTSGKRTIGSYAAIGIITPGSFALGITLISRFKTFTSSFGAAAPFGNILGVSQEDLLAIVVAFIATNLVIILGY